MGSCKARKNSAVQLPIPPGRSSRTLNLTVLEN